MMLHWFDATLAKDFGAALARSFAQGIPVTQNFGDKAFEMKATKLLKLMAGQVSKFKAENKLNPYKKAQLGNAFRWGLVDAGIPQDYADKLTKWLMLQIG
jgi:hypothetical protein